MRKLSANYIYTLTGNPISEGVVVVHEDGSINDILNNREGVDDIEVFDGVITPGFINTHCHLELSYLKGKVEEGLGIAEFILSVEEFKQASDEVKLDAIKMANIEMIENGIVAVGDISNTNISFSEKQKSKISFHTFIELYGFNPDYAKAIIDGAKVLSRELMTLDLGWSIAPHSPYSVSKALFEEIMDIANGAYFPMTIHNQESDAENEMFLEGTGNLMEMKKKLGAEVSSWKSTGKRSIETSIRNMASENNLLLVHNTFTNLEDLQFAESKSDYLYWCMCVNANWYIERALPDIYMFEDAGVRITLGTDSIASNYSLSILDEMKTISKYYKDVSIESLLNWGCKNGAEYLGLENQLGTLEVGKTPGINLISGLEEDNKLNSKSKVTKLY
ncbi:MAG: amidohydrolase family protein [Flavobacteriales bacterium]|nr:amidohydrolase family protein [Flavobacteriales bacterium]